MSIPKPLRGAVFALLSSVFAAALLFSAGPAPEAPEERLRTMPVPGGEADDLLRMEEAWNHRLTYPTGLFNPAWLRLAARADALIPSAIPGGVPFKATLMDAPLALSSAAFTPLGPMPERMTGCSGCYDYGTTTGRINAVVIDPTTTTNGSIVAYAASDGGGVWKTTNCCSASTSWTVTTDDPLISTTAIDALDIDPNDHNTIYAGTGDLNFGSFSFGSQGILKTTNGGASWRTLGAEVFGPALLQPAGQFPQYDAVGKVRVDPNNSNRVVAGTKRGLYLSYDAGESWTGPCLTNNFTTQRQDITGLELSDLGSSTRIIAAVGVRGYATPVQYNLDQNGANGIYRATMPASGCPAFTAISTETNGWAGKMATSGVRYGGANIGNQLGRIDLAVAPSDPNYIYAQVQAITLQSSCGAQGCQLAAWRTTDGGTTWTQIPGSDGASLLDCEGGAGDYPQNWYDQGVAVDPNNPNRVVFDTFDIWFWDGSNALTQNLPWNNLTCGYGTTNNGVHVDQHSLTFVPGSSSILLAGNDGGVHATTAATSMNSAVDPTWFGMLTGFNTIEFYGGDISGNFANSPNPQAVAGAQDNGASSVSFVGYPTGAVQWQMGLGGDGFSGQIDPVGTGTSLRFWQGNNSGGLSRCISNCTASGATWSSRKGGWGTETQSFILPINLFHGGIPGGDDCGPAGATTGCGHLLAATTRVWETISGATATNTWYVSNNPTNQNLTKATLGNRSYINQVKYSPKFQSVAIVGTNDGNVQIGFNLGTGVQAQANWVNVTGNNTVLPNRPVLGIALDPGVTARDVPIGYASIGGFNANTPSTPGHLFQVTCAKDCASYTWANKTGNLPDIPAGAVIVNPNLPNQVFVGTDWGLYFTDNISAATPSWSRFDSGLPHAMIWDMQIDRGSTTLSLFTRSRGAWVAALPTASAANTPPVARFTSAAGSQSLQLHVDASASSDPDGDAISSYQFDFGDGSNPVSQSNPVVDHSYASAGDYTISLIVTDSRGAVSPAAAQSVHVNAAAQSPNAFTYLRRTGVAQNVFVTSEGRQLSGYSGTLRVSVSAGGQYRVDSGPWTNVPSDIAPEQILTVRHQSSSAANTETTTTVTVGGYSTPFQTVTSDKDRVPDGFVFESQSGVEAGATIESNLVTPSGFNAPIMVEPAAGQEWRVAGGSYSAAKGSLQPGQSVQVQHVANSSQLGYSKSTLKLGGIAGTFTTRTR